MIEIHVSQEGGKAVEQIQRFIKRHGIRVLNVAGSRESKEPGIHRWVVETLREVFS